MSDTNERSVASDSSVEDIVDSLCAAIVPTPMPTRGLLVAAAAEIERLRFAIRRLADQDATLSVCDGNVTVTMDATLTDAEREAIERACRVIASTLPYESQQGAEEYRTLRGLLERLK